MTAKKKSIPRKNTPSKSAAKQVQKKSTDRAASIPKAKSPNNTGKGKRFKGQHGAPMTQFRRIALERYLAASEHNTEASFDAHEEKIIGIFQNGEKWNAPATILQKGSGIAEPVPLTGKYTPFQLITGHPWQDYRFTKNNADRKKVSILLNDLVAERLYYLSKIYKSTATWMITDILITLLFDKEKQKNFLWYLQSHSYEGDKSCSVEIWIPRPLDKALEKFCSEQSWRPLARSQFVRTAIMYVAGLCGQGVMPTPAPD